MLVLWIFGSYLESRIGIFKNKSEDLYDKAIELIDVGFGLDDAEKSLHKALKFDPENPDIKQELARLYSARVDTDAQDNGRKFYLNVKERHFLFLWKHIFRSP